MTLSFSLWGLLGAALILLPTLLWTCWPPVNQVPVRPAPFPYGLLEKVGQVGCLVFLCVEMPLFSFSLTWLEGNRLWVWVMLGLLSAYWALWLRYYGGGRQYRDLYQPFLVPVPLAVVPSILFIVVGLLRAHFFLLAFGVLFAIGHIRESLCIYEQIQEKE